MKCYDFWPSVLPINHEIHPPLPYKIGRMKKIEGEGLKVLMWKRALCYEIVDFIGMGQWV